MNGEYLLMLLSRYFHILSATLAIGVPIYVRLVLMPSLLSLDETNRGKFRDALASRWRPIVGILIAAFLLTGLYNFLVVARWRTLAPDNIPQYHMLFGLKFCLALAMFFLSSALAGRSPKLAFIRQNAKWWIGVLIALALAVLLLSTLLRTLFSASQVA